MGPNPEWLKPLAVWLHSWPTADLMDHTKWAWAICESLHFAGLCLLFGTVVMFDLRLLGLAPRIPARALHSLVPYGVAGFTVNALTGFFFLTAAPEQYLYNGAFRWKVVFLILAGLNVLVFYAVTFSKLERQR